MNAYAESHICVNAYAESHTGRVCVNAYAESHICVNAYAVAHCEFAHWPSMCECVCSRTLAEYV